VEQVGFGGVYLKWSLLEPKRNPSKRPTHRLPARLIRWTSLSVCFALVLSCFVVTPLAKPDHKSKALAQGQSGSQDGKAKKVEPAPPVTGPPAANLPNLDEVKQRRQEAPGAPEPCKFDTSLAAQAD